MDVDEAKALFALMGWNWQAQPLGFQGRARMPPLYQWRYEVFVNEVMVEARRASSRQVRPDPNYPEYENYDVDRCLTRYAEIYTEYIVNKKD